MRSSGQCEKSRTPRHSMETDTLPLPQVIVLADSAYPGISGFIPGSRGSLMLDVVFVAMFVVVPLLAASIYLVKYRQKYALHKRLQLAMAAVLLVAVLLFELDIRINGWEERAAGIPPGTGSPYFDYASKWSC